jgi:hypothetical protein
MKALMYRWTVFAYDHLTGLYAKHAARAMRRSRSVVENDRHLS